MKITDASHHITGHYPLRVLDEAERSQLGCILVGWQEGFERFVIAVYGDGLEANDAAEAAEEYASELGRWNGVAPYSDYQRRVR